jgi:hypothetical protein
MIDLVQVAHCGNNGSAPYGTFQHSNKWQAVLKMRDRYPPALNPEYIVTYPPMSKIFKELILGIYIHGFQKK